MGVDGVWGSAEGSPMARKGSMRNPRQWPEDATGERSVSLAKMCVVLPRTSWPSDGNFYQWMRNIPFPDPEIEEGLNERAAASGMTPEEVEIEVLKHGIAAMKAGLPFC